MLVYACLPIYSRYVDRYRMFMELAKLGIRVRMILLHGEHPPASSMPSGFEQISFPQGLSKYGRRAFFRQVIVPAPDGEPTIIHDTFLLQMGFSMRHRWTRHRRANVRNILSLFSPNPSFLFGGYWLGPKGYRIRISEIPFYLRKDWPLLPAEFISAHLADMVTGNTEQIVHDIRWCYRVPESRSRFVPAESDNEFFTPGPMRRTDLALPEKDKIALYVGNLQRRKGIDIALQSINELYSRCPNVRFVLLGKVADSGYVWFRTLLDSLPVADNVEIRESVGPELLREYYRSCDVLLFPTRHEGCPRVVKEAMACGCPIVASCVPGIRAIDPKLESIVCAEGWNPVEYANLLERILCDLSYRQERIDAGFRVVERLSSAAIALQWATLYRELFN